MKASRTYKVGSTGEAALPAIAAKVKKHFISTFPLVEVDYWKGDEPNCYYLSVAHPDLTLSLQQQGDRSDLKYIAERHPDVVRTDDGDTGIPSNTDMINGALPWVSIRVYCK